MMNSITHLNCISTDCVHNVSNITGEQADLFCNLKYSAISLDGKCVNYIKNPSPPAKEFSQSPAED